MHFIVCSKEFFWKIPNFRNFPVKFPHFLNFCIFGFDRPESISDPLIPLLSFSLCWCCFSFSRCSGSYCSGTVSTSLLSGHIGGGNNKNWKFHFFLILILYQDQDLNDFIFDEMIFISDWIESWGTELNHFEKDYDTQAKECQEMELT